MQSTDSQESSKSILAGGQVIREHVAGFVQKFDCKLLTHAVLHPAVLLIWFTTPDTRLYEGSVSCGLCAQPRTQQIVNLRFSH